jgi:hypothetical protein
MTLEQLIENNGWKHSLSFGQIMLPRYSLCVFFELQQKFLAAYDIWDDAF